MNDTQIPTSLPQAQLSAVARPVDTFVAPAQTWRSEGDGLMEAAKALQELNPKLQAWFQQEKQDQEEAATDYGYNLNKNRESFNGYMKRLEQDDPDKFEQVKGMNPHVQRGFNQAFLEGKAMNYSMALSRDLANDPMIAEKDEATGLERQISVFATKDPAAIQTWLTDHRQKWADANGLADIDQRDLREFFNPKATAMEMQVVTKRAAEYQNQFYDKLGEQVQQNAIQGITAVYQGTDLSDPEEANASAKAAGVLMSRALNMARDHGYTEMGKLGNAMIKAVTAMAEDTRNPRMLEALNHVETSPGSYLGKTGAAQEAIAQTRFNIERRNHTELEWARGDLKFRWEMEDRPWALQTREWSRQSHQREIAENTLKDSLRNAKGYLAAEIMADPAKNWEGDELFKRMTKADPSAAAEMIHFRDTWIGMRESARSDDANSFANLMRDMAADPSGFEPERLTKAFTSGLLTRNSVKLLWDDLRRFREAAVDPWLGHAEFRAMVSGLRQAVAQAPDGKGYGPAAYQAGEAERVLRRKARIWKSDPKNQGRGFDGFMDDMEIVSRDLMNTYNPEAGADLLLNSSGQSDPALTRAVDALLQEPTPERVRHLEESFPGQKAEAYLKLIRGQSWWERFWDTDLYGNAVR